MTKRKRGRPPGTTTGAGIRSTIVLDKCIDDNLKEIMDEKDKRKATLVSEIITKYLDLYKNGTDILDDKITIGEPPSYITDDNIPVDVEYAEAHQDEEPEYCEAPEQTQEEIREFGEQVNMIHRLADEYLMKMLKNGVDLAPEKKYVEAMAYAQKRYDELNKKK